MSAANVPHGQKPQRRSFLQNLASIWSALDLRKRMVVVAATIGVFLAVLGLTRFSGGDQMALLYAGLDSAAAGEVIAALDQKGIVYEVRGDSIFVEAGGRDSLRMTLAGEGLPAVSATGYELLDNLSGFGTTSQMFDAAYWRAKEGELARTILANPLIKTARVHIALAPSQPFRNPGKASASVTVTTVSGTLPASQAKALKHLISSAVPGMLPEAVSVIDSVAGLILPEGETDLPDPAGLDRAAELRKNIERLLEARVGAGKAVVEVSVDVVTEREEITERKFDPQGRVAISTDTEEKSDSATEAGGDVTVASNLPEGDAEGGGGGKSQSTETRERINFEVSETNRALVRAPGAIRKLTVAVLVDGLATTNADGTSSWAPRPEEELAVLRELVSSAAGIDEGRGDVLTLKSLQFETPPEAGTLAEAKAASIFGALDVMSLIKMAVLALVTIVLGLFVIRPVLAGPAPALRGSDVTPMSLPEPATPTLEAVPGEDGFRVVTGEIDGQELPFRESELAAMEAARSEDPVERLRRLIDERGAESVEILRGWLEEEEA